MRYTTLARTAPKPRRLLVAALSISIGALAPTLAWAQSDADRATARALFFQAQAALDKQDYTAAADFFGRSDALMHAPTASLGFARAQVGLGRLVGAYETYNRLVREGVAPGAAAAFVKALEDARKELAALEKRLPTVVISVAGPAEPVVTVDDMPVPKAALGINRFVDPGTHRVKVSGRGYLPAEKEITLEEGGSSRVQLVLSRDPKYPAVGGDGSPAAAPPAESSPAAKPGATATSSPDAPPPQRTRRTIGLVVGGVGAAGLVAGGVAGILFARKKGEAEDHCTAALRCDPEGLDAVSAAGTLGTVATLALVGGALAVGAGTVLVVTGGSADAPRARAAILSYRAPF